MNKEQQRIKIAEACGWKKCTHPETLGWHDDATLCKACGEFIEQDGQPIEISFHEGWITPDGERGLLPNYPADLNAMHEAEKVLTADWSEYLLELWKICNPNANIGPCHPNGHFSKKIVMATAAQRAEAFLKTLGLWEEGE